MALTVLTVYTQPAPLKLGAQHLTQLEERCARSWQSRMAGEQASRRLSQLCCCELCSSTLFVSLEACLPSYKRLQGKR